MKRRSGRMRQNANIKQKLGLKTIVIYGTISVIAFATTMAIFNFSDFSNAKAKEFSIQSAEDQIFISDFTIPEPQLKAGSQANSSTIFIQRIKAEPVISVQNHE